MQIIIEAVSWNNRRVKVASKWHDVAPNVNLKQLRVGQLHEVEVAKGLDGNVVLMRVIN
jgi:hypothetical protein